MKLIVGLGNPGPRYEKTRHNIGFEILSAFADRHFFPAAKSRFDGLVTDHSINGEKVVLLAPQTYMNASGTSVRQCVDFYKIDHNDVMVVVDDMNLDVGRMRVRASGSAGGQKGLADTIRHLGTDKVSRLRVGEVVLRGEWLQATMSCSGFQRLIGPWSMFVFRKPPTDWSIGSRMGLRRR